MPGNRYRVHHVPGMGFNSAPCGGDMVDLELLIRRKSTLLTLVDLPLASRRLQRRTNWEMRRLPWKPRSRGCRTSCKRGCSPAPPPSWPWRSPPPPPRRSSSSSPRRRRRPPTWAGRRPDTPRRRTPGQCRFSRNSNGEPPQIAAAAGRRGTQRRHLGKFQLKGAAWSTTRTQTSGETAATRIDLDCRSRKQGKSQTAWFPRGVFVSSPFFHVPLLPSAVSVVCILVDLFALGPFYFGNIDQFPPSPPKLLFILLSSMLAPWSASDMSKIK